MQAVPWLATHICVTRWLASHMTRYHEQWWAVSLGPQPVHFPSCRSTSPAARQEHGLLSNHGTHQAKQPSSAISLEPWRGLSVTAPCKQFTVAVYLHRWPGGAGGA